MAYKVFSNGDALTGSELNTYLMNQSVIQFASTTARDAAIPSPAEGQLVWLQDVNKYVYYTGSAWADLITPAGGDNAIINGAFDIWQRGTSFASPADGLYTADRFITFQNGTGATRTISQQTFTPGTAPVAGYESSYFFRYLCSNLGSGNSYQAMQNRIEDVRTFAGQTVTFSFWAKADSAKTITLALIQNFGSGGSSAVNVDVATTFSLTTSWTRFTRTVAVPSIAGKTIGAGSFLQLGFELGSQVITFDTWGWQLESGSTATTFRRNAVNFAEELASCKRYYQRFNSINTYGLFGFGKAYNGSTLNLVFSLPVQMRTTPNAIETSAMSTIQFETGSTSGNTPTSITLNAFTSTPSIVGADLNKSGAFSTGAFYFVQASNSASAYIAFGAEL